MATATLNNDVATALLWAEFYRARGWNPLPSRTDEKRPLVRFAQWWDEAAPSNLFDQHPTTNIQLMTGRRWRLLVLDLDGPDAPAWLASHGRPLPRTWVTHSGGGGRHLWFRLPADCPKPLPKAFLWKGDERHSAVERLCDRSLIMAPPSIHPKTGQRYQFASKGESPARLPMPADCPAWLLALPTLAPPRPEPVLMPRATPRTVVASGRYRADDVLSAIGDKAALAESWGLRLASHRPNSAGWCPCHALGREDRTPSASFSPTTGCYWEPGQLKPVGLFTLAVMLGAYSDWRDAVNDLGSIFHAREAA